MRCRHLAVEALENRAMLAANVLAETVAVFPQESLPGDANHDGSFDQSDVLQVLEAGKYMTGGEATWGEGDWNGDGTFDQLDVVFALQTGKYSLGVAAQGQGQEVERPFHAEGDVQWLGLQDPPAGRCPAGYMLSTFVGTYQASHLGRATAIATHCTNPNDLTFVDGEFTLIAANRDELSATYEGETPLMDPPMVGWTDEVVFTDRTGRFSGATGSATESGTMNMGTGVGSSTIDGVIIFNASQRRA